MKLQVVNFVTKNHLIPLILTIVYIGNAQGIIIRHDVGPARYEVRSSDYPAVFFLEQQGNRRICAATVIHSKWAITAAHCLDETMVQNTIDNGGQYAVRIGGKDRKIDAVIRHPNYYQTNVDEVDLALLRFQGDSLTPRPIPLQIENNELGQEVSIFGWGYFGLGTFGRQYNDSELRRAKNRIFEAARRLRIRFEDPRTRNSGALQLEGMPSLGDSGGPAIINLEVEPRLAGVAVGEQIQPGFSEETQGKYGSIAVYERISAHIKWIETVIGAKAPFDH
jgi:secreted trypsin-like serine protease